MPYLQIDLSVVTLGDSDLQMELQHLENDYRESQLENNPDIKKKRHKAKKKLKKLEQLAEEQFDDGRISGLVKEQYDVSRMSVRTLRRTKSQLRIATTVDSLAIVYPDRYQSLSSFWKPTNAMHVASLLWEFLQMSAFSFERKLPWQDGAGVGTISSLMDGATLRLEELPLGDYWGVKAQFYDWFIFCTVLLIALYITTVFWIKWSVVDRHSKRCRMSPCLCFVPVKLLKPFSGALFFLSRTFIFLSYSLPSTNFLATGVLFLPVLRMLFSALSRSLYQSEHFGLVVSVLDSVEVRCWTGHHYV